MKLVILAALIVLSAFRAQAGVKDFGAMVQGGGPFCTVRPAVRARVAYLPERPALCCDNGIRCSQLLATTKMEPVRAPSHT